MVDLTPQSLKLTLGKVLVERIFLNLGFVTVGEHILENAVVIDSLNERVDAVRHRPQFLRQLRNGSVLNILAVLVRHLALHIHIAVLNKVELDSIGFLVVDKRRHIVHLDIFALEVILCFIQQLQPICGFCAFLKCNIHFCKKFLAAVCTARFRYICPYTCSASQ